MTNEKVSNLHVLDGAGKTNNPLITRFEEFINEELLDFDDADYLDLIDLEAAKPDEVLLGSLSDFEKRCFALSELVSQSISDTLLEYEALATEAMAVHIRENKVPLMSAIQHHMQHLPIETRIDLNKRAITHTTLVTSFEWSVRSRYSKWVGHLVVRKNFVVYTHG